MLQWTEEDKNATFSKNESNVKFIAPCINRDSAILWLKWLPSDFYKRPDLRFTLFGMATLPANGKTKTCTEVDSRYDLPRFTNLGNHKIIQWFEDLMGTDLNNTGKIFTTTTTTTTESTTKTTTTTTSKTTTTTTKPVPGPGPETEPNPKPGPKTEDPDPVPDPDPDPEPEPPKPPKPPSGSVENENEGGGRDTDEQNKVGNGQDRNAKLTKIWSIPMLMVFEWLACFTF